MDTPSNGGRDSRFNLNSYEIPILSGDNGSEIGYNSNILHSRPTSITSSLSRSSGSLNSSCGPGLQRGLKRTSSEMCYDPNLSSRSSNLMGSDCSSDIMEDTYSPTNQKNSPLSNGKKTKGRVKIKMEYIDNKLRRYTTFSKRKTGIMKKAYELSTLTGTQVMLLVASETGHVYTFATRKLQPMITSEAGKALIQTCLNSPDPCPSGSGDQRMSATGFEETELSYNIGDDEKVDTSSCSPYRSDSSDSSDVESISVSPSSSPPPLISLQDLQSSPSSAVTVAASIARTDNRARNVGHDNQANQHIVLKNLKHEPTASSSNGIACNTIMNCCTANNTSSSTSTPSNVSMPATSSPSMLNGSNVAGGSVVFTLEQLQREFGLRFTNMGDTPGAYITIPMLSGMTNAANSNPPAAHQTPADLSNRPRK